MNSGVFVTLRTAAVLVAVAIIAPSCGPSYPTDVFERDPGGRFVTYRLTDADQATVTRTTVEPGGPFPMEDQVIHARIVSEFLSLYGDNYDFVYLVYAALRAEDKGAGAFNLFGYHVPVRNDVTGLGIVGSAGGETFDRGAAFGSAARLQSVVIHYATQFTVGANPRTYLGTRGFFHEMMHRWGQYVFVADPGDNGGHYSAPGTFKSWIQMSEGTFETLTATGAVENGLSVFRGTWWTGERLGALDMYLMGLATADELEPLTYLQGCQTQGACTFRDEDRTGGTVVGGSLRMLSADDLRSRLPGARQPALGPTEFRAAVVVLLPPNGDAAILSESARATLGAELETIAGAAATSPNFRSFRSMTWNRGSLRTDIDVPRQ